MPHDLPALAALAHGRAPRAPLRLLLRAVVDDRASGLRRQLRVHRPVLRAALTDQPGFRALRPDDASLDAFLDRKGVVRALRIAWLQGLLRDAAEHPEQPLLRQLARQPDPRMQLGFGLTEAMDDALVTWVQADQRRRRNLARVLVGIAPPDPGPAASAKAEDAWSRFRSWEAYAFRLVIVPGYTPLDQKTDPTELHPTARKRLEQAVADRREKRAAFIMVSGANVYPPGTRVYEALMMKDALLALGVREDRILVEARARHSTTNLRNAGRWMRAHGLDEALVTTTFGQDFYFSHPRISTFHRRCRKELGYEVGELRDHRAHPRHTVFRPSKKVQRVDLRDPLDP